MDAAGVVAVCPIVGAREIIEHGFVVKKLSLLFLGKNLEAGDF